MLQKVSIKNRSIFLINFFFSSSIILGKERQNKKKVEKSHLQRDVSSSKEIARNYYP